MVPTWPAGVNYLPCPCEATENETHTHVDACVWIGPGVALTPECSTELLAFATRET